MMPGIHIERACPADAAAVLRLLAESRLPGEGLREHLGTAVVARRDDGAIVGSAALEMYPDGALLRAVAVAVDRQGQHLGHELTDAAIRLAHDLGSPAVYLLTTTAERFFPKFGFEPIGRDDVPATVRTSVEFRSACPSSAIVMRKRLA